MAPKKQAPPPTPSKNRTTRRTTRATSTQPDAPPLAEGLPANPAPRRRTRAQSSQPDNSPLAPGLAPEPPKRRGRKPKAKKPSPTPEPSTDNLEVVDDQDFRPTSSGSADVAIETTERDLSVAISVDPDDDILSLEGEAGPGSFISASVAESFDHDDSFAHAYTQETIATQETVSDITLKSTAQFPEETNNSQLLALSEYVMNTGVDPTDVIVERATRIEEHESIMSGGIEEEYQWKRAERNRSTPDKKEEFRKRRMFDKLHNKPEKPTLEEVPEEDSSNDWVWEGKPRPRQGWWDSSSNTPKKFPNPKPADVPEEGTPQTRSKQVSMLGALSNGTNAANENKTRKPAKTGPSVSSTHTPAAPNGMTATADMDLSDAPDENMEVEAAPAVQPVFAFAPVAATPSPAKRALAGDSDDEEGGWGIKSFMNSGKKIFASVGKYIPGYSPAKRQRVEISEQGSPTKSEPVRPPNRTTATPSRPRRTLGSTSVRRRQARARSSTQQDDNNAEARLQFEDEFDDQNGQSSNHLSTPMSVGALSKRKRDAPDASTPARRAIQEAPWTTGRRAIQSPGRRRFRRAIQAGSEASPGEETATGTLEAFFGFEGPRYEDWMRAAGHNRLMFKDGPPDLRDPNENLPRFPSLPWTKEYVDMEGYLPSQNLTENWTFMRDLKYERRKFRCSMVQLLTHSREERLRFLVSQLGGMDSMDYALILTWFSPALDNWKQWVPGFSNFSQFNPQGLQRLQFEYCPDLFPSGYKPTSPGRTFALEYSDDEDEDSSMTNGNESGLAPSKAITQSPSKKAGAGENSKGPNGEAGRWTQAPPAAPVPAHATLPKTTTAAPAQTPASAPPANIFGSPKAPQQVSSSGAPGGPSSASEITPGTASAAPSTSTAATPSKDPKTVLQRAHVNKHKPTVPSKLSQELGRSSSDTDDSTIVRGNRPAMSLLNQPVPSPVTKAARDLPPPLDGSIFLPPPASGSVLSPTSPTFPSGTSLSLANIEESVRQAKSDAFDKDADDTYFGPNSNYAVQLAKPDEVSGFPNPEKVVSERAMEEDLRKAIKINDFQKEAYTFHFPTAAATADGTKKGQLSASGFNKWTGVPEYVDGES